MVHTLIVTLTRDGKVRYTRNQQVDIILFLSWGEVKCLSFTHGVIK